jgi:hypothetical protein
MRQARSRFVLARKMIWSQQEDRGQVQCEDPRRPPSTLASVKGVHHKRLRPDQETGVVLGSELGAVVVPYPLERPKLLLLIRKYCQIWASAIYYPHA